MKSSRERMRKEEMQLTISLMPLAMESNRLFPPEGRQKEQLTFDWRDRALSRSDNRNTIICYISCVNVFIFLLCV